MADNGIAVITGGARGIGLACAEALRDDGHRVVLVDIDGDEAAAAASKLGAGAVSYNCDIGDSDAIGPLFDAIEADIGPARVLVNNAGVAMPGSFLDYDLADFQKVMNINLIGAFLATQRAAKAMVANTLEGAVVNMTSINAQLAIPAIPAYCASKGGLMQITKVAALALAEHNIRVNAVGPGSINTDMLASVNANPDAMAMVMSRTPMKRIGEAREIADVVAFLASSKASYVTGETIYVDGGRLGLNYTV